MKILTISDNVLPQLENTTNLQTVYGGVDAIISCGDLPAQYIDVIASVLNAPLFYVRGNHDTNYQPGEPGGDNLHGRFVTYENLTFAGLEGSPRYNNGSIQYDELQMLAMVLNLGRKLLIRRVLGRGGIDVMVTHAPPRGIHDLPDHAHRGFRCLNLLINLYHPRYLIHGHVDTPDRRKQLQTRVGKTEVININPMKVLTIERKPS